jgi:membrane protein DedA with SNARE-associated domain
MTNLLLTHGSYLLIFIVLVLTGSGLPIPEEVPIIAAGILSAQETLDPWLAFITCLLGAIIGDCVMYIIGYHFGRPVLQEHPWWARFVTAEREAQIEQQFRLHGFKVFFVARFLVGIRSPVYLTAGILRVSFRRFLLIDLFCATMVVGTFFGLTYLFGTTVAKWLKQGEVVLTILVMLALAGVSIYLWRRYYRKIAMAKSNSGNISVPCAYSSGSSPAQASPEETPKARLPLSSPPSNSSPPLNQQAGHSERLAHSNQIDK